MLRSRETDRPQVAKDNCEPYDGRRITGVLVGVDDPRRRMVRSAQGFGEEALSRCCVAFIIADRRKSIVAPLESTARYR